MALRATTKFADFTNAASDVFYNFVEPSTEKIIGDTVEWERSTKLDEFAVSLIRHQKALEKLQVRMNDSDLLVAEENETEVVDGCTARHLGAGVIALELPENPVEDEDVSKAGATVLSRSNIRSIVKKTIDILKSGDSVFLIGQPGKCVFQFQIFAKPIKHLLMFSISLSIRNWKDTIRSHWLLGIAAVRGSASIVCGLQVLNGISLYTKAG
jgi:hypothetical protein